MALPQFTKQVSENLDYTFDFSVWMALIPGDSLPVSTSASVITADSGITVGTKTHGTNAVVQFLSGGVDGQDYEVHCVITSTQGRVKEADMLLRVRNT